MALADMFALLRKGDASLMPLHYCSKDTPHGSWGAAIDVCSENEKGEFWVANDEYGSQVNFCPYCGAPAPTQLPLNPDPMTTPMKAWGLVLLDNPYDENNKRVVPDRDLHIYEESPGVTKCGRNVPLRAYGWFSGGGDINSPHFPFGPICAKCKEAHLPLNPEPVPPRNV